MSDQPDQTLQQILETLESEDHLGVLLAAQLGGTPQEVQLILQTTEYNDTHDALRPIGQYIIRAIGVREHRLSVGLFGTMVLSHQNALLYPHNEKMIQVYFRGSPENVDSLMIELNQLYGQTYGQYDPLRRMAEEINPARPLESLLKGGQGLLGNMPEPFAQKVAALLERHQMKARLLDDEEANEHRPPMQFQSLVMDDSFLIAQLFSADPMGSPGG
ncbi:MAG TPA: hypothetical protein VJZ27_07995 [Aggregatilineales bacterium]|nr:hypothetical protein [Aggregatilineales bacterium]